MIGIAERVRRRRADRERDAGNLNRADRGEQGFVLITVVIMIAILFPIVVVFFSKAQLNLLQAANFRDNIQAVRAARSGIDGAIGLLRTDDPTFDAKTDKWAMPFPSIGVAEGLLEVRISDEDGKINLNHLILANGVDVNRDLEARLRKLIIRLGEKPEIVDALIDWIDINSELTGEGGAEDTHYRPLGYSAKNGFLDSMDELLLVKGFTRELLENKGLKNFVTVVQVADQVDGKVNINTAPIEVLYVLHEELREGLVDEIVRYREEKEFKDVASIKNAIGINDTLFAKIQPLIKVNSSIFLVKSRYTTGHVVRSVDALLKRDSGFVTIMSWRES